MGKREERDGKELGKGVCQSRRMAAGERVLGNDMVAKKGRNLCRM